MKTILVVLSSLLLTACATSSIVMPDIPVQLSPYTVTCDGSQRNETITDTGCKISNFYYTTVDNEHWWADPNYGVSLTWAEYVSYREHIQLANVIVVRLIRVGDSKVYIEYRDKSNPATFQPTLSPNIVTVPAPQTSVKTELNMFRQLPADEQDAIINKLQSIHDTNN